MDPATLQVSHTAQAVVASSDVASTDGEAGNVNKKGKKFDKLKCFRCGHSGHLLFDCDAELCEFCEEGSISLTTVCSILHLSLRWSCIGPLPRS